MSGQEKEEITAPCVVAVGGKEEVVDKETLCLNPGSGLALQDPDSVVH